MIQIIIILILFIVLIVPMGKYLYHISVKEPTFADPLFDKVDNVIYRICGTDPTIEMSWKKYAVSMLVTNAIMVIIGFFILRFQSGLLLNPNEIDNMTADLSFNTVISFMTNTNLQHYAGESGLSYFSQMAVITFMMFTSAATGYAVCMAFIRGVTGRTKHMGNYFVDMIRIITRVFIPISLIAGLFLVSQGVPQNLSSNITVQTIEGTYQDIAMGPIASLEVIKHLGTNGGGFFGANSSMPFENPNVITNMVEMLLMMILPGACVIAFGLMVKNRAHAAVSREKSSWIEKEARPIFAVMLVLLIIGLSVCYMAELNGNPKLEETGLSQSMGNMEGKETRFGIAQSTMFTTITTAFTTGSVNNMHDSLTPVGGAVPMVNMMLNLIFGGKGVGLMNIILYTILAVFICGLMIGQTPQYLNKKIEGREMTLTSIGIIVHPLLILGFSALAVAVPAGLAGLGNPGFHGLSQVIYEFASSAANNGSGFEGLLDNTVFWNITTSVVMFLGRYVIIVLQLAIAGSLIGKMAVAESAGSLKTNTFTFTVSLFMVIIVFAALTFFPVLMLGPGAEAMTLIS